MSGGAARATGALVAWLAALGVAPGDSDQVRAQKSTGES